MAIQVMRFDGLKIRNLNIAFGFLLYFYFSSMLIAETMPSGSFDNTACVDCHNQRNYESPDFHARANEKVFCIACHGDSHENVAARARQDEACIDCHGGKKEPVVHSYLTSKHGLILKLEKKEWDWTQSLAEANYRTPGCAYCHMHAGEHNVSSGVRDADLLDKNEEKLKAVQGVMRSVCQDCHAPRYLTRLFENGERMLEIARMKVREARDLLVPARKKYSAEKLGVAESQYQKMQLHLKNVYLGVAHQSPDYQWWHGHPALDGDLLRIKGAINELLRREKLREH